MNIYKTISVGKQILEAFVLAKTGKIKKAGVLFAEASENEAVDPIMEGLARSLQELEGGDDVDSDSDIDVGVEDDEDEDEDIDVDIDNEDEDEDEDEEDEDKGNNAGGEDVSIPATVASVLDLEY